jgi:DNA (cytosine-5)-methyltransferase 1
MRVGSLFSGIGGLDLGLERAGMEIAWQVENDDFCRRVLAKHWPNVPCYGDIREVRGTDVEPVDLICGGFPCQPTSHAGRRRGEGDDRWLWPEMLRLIREVKPAYVVGENVFGLVTHDEGLLLASIVADLAAEGFEVAPPVVFPACAVGALHRRDRVWICAYARHNDRGAEQGVEQAQRAEVADGVRATADADGIDVQGRQRGGIDEERRSFEIERPSGLRSADTAALSDADDARFVRPAVHARPRGEGQGTAGSTWRSGWAVEPSVGRVAHGVSGRVDRLKALGNAVVPQVAELVGRHLMETRS